MSDTEWPIEKADFRDDAAKGTWRISPMKMRLNQEVISSGNACERRAVVEKLSGRMRTAFSSSKCSRTHYGRHCEPLSGGNALDCTILYIRSRHFPGMIPQTSAKAPLHADANFRFVRQRSHCSQFTKRPLTENASKYGRQ